MQIKTTYKGITEQGIKGIWCGFKPDNITVTEEIQILYPDENKKYSTKGCKQTQTIDKQLLAEGDTVTFKVWLNYKDGIYNGLVMNPYDEDYQKGLTITQSVVFKDDAKIFGKIAIRAADRGFGARDVLQIPQKSGEVI